jgi:hypothetical protein
LAQKDDLPLPPPPPPTAWNEIGSFIVTSLKSGLNYRPDAVHKYLRNTDILYSYEARNVPVWLVNKLMGFQVLIYKHLVQNNMQYMSTLLATYEK